MNSHLWTSSHWWLGGQQLVEAISLADEESALALENDLLGKGLSFAPV
jgi:hypothetical protein